MPMSCQLFWRPRSVWLQWAEPWSLNPVLQADSSWRKVAVKLEGEPAYEQLDKADRVEVFTDYIRQASPSALHLVPRIRV